MSRLILGDGATQADMLALAEAQGWALIGDTPRTHTRFRAFEFRTPEGNLGWYEHHGLGVRVLEYPGEATLAALAALPQRTVAELQADIGAEDPVVAMRALNALFLTDAHEAFFAAMAVHAVHPHLWVRRNACHLARYVRDPRAVESLRSGLADPELGAYWKEQIERLENPS